MQPSIIAGIDEAGRGPVLGPLVMAIACIDESDERLLAQAGITDSKLLTPKKREQLAEILPGLLLHFQLIVIEPKDIDTAVNSPNDNLNALELRSSANLIRSAPLSLSRVYVDSPTRGTAAYGVALQEASHRDVGIIAENKADLRYPIVGAASILAKVARDRVLADFSVRTGLDVGSGYPGDPKTRAFLASPQAAEHLPFIRRSWQTYKDIVGLGQQKLFHIGPSI